MGEEFEWRAAAEGFAEPVASLIRGEREQFVRSSVATLGGLAGPVGKELATAVYDRLKLNANDRLFLKYLATQEEQEASKMFLATVAEAVHEITRRDQQEVIREIRALKTPLVDVPMDDPRSATSPQYDGPQTSRLVSARYRAEFCEWAPLAKRIDRITLDLIDSRMYIHRSPSFVEDAQQQILDINQMIRLYNEGVRATGASPMPAQNAVKGISGGDDVLREGLVAVRQFELLQQFPIQAFRARSNGMIDDNLREYHFSLVERFDEGARALTAKRDRLRTIWTRMEFEARRRLEEDGSVVGGDSLLGGLVQTRILPYLAAVRHLVAVLAEQIPGPSATLSQSRLWIERSLTPAIEDLNKHVAWICDDGTASILRLTGQGISLHAALDLLTFIDWLIQYHYEHVRDPLNRALAPVFRLDQDPSAPLGMCVEQIRRVIADSSGAFGRGMDECRRQAEGFLGNCRR